VVKYRQYSLRYSTLLDYRLKTESPPKISGEYHKKALTESTKRDIKLPKRIRINDPDSPGNVIPETQLIMPQKNIRPNFHLCAGFKKLIDYFQCKSTIPAVMVLFFPMSKSYAYEVNRAQYHSKKRQPHT